MRTLAQRSTAVVGRRALHASSIVAAPATMRAVVVHQTGDASALTTEGAWAVPKPTDGQCLIKNEARRRRRRRRRRLLQTRANIPGTPPRARPRAPRAPPRSIPRTRGVNLTSRPLSQFAGLNFIDTYHRSGLYPRDLPFIGGQEGAGVVEEVTPKVRAPRRAAPRALA